MVCDPKEEINLNRSRSLSCVFSSFSSPSKEPEPKKVGSLAKILSWFSFTRRTQNANANINKQKKRTLQNLIARLVKKGKTKGRVVFKSSNAKFLCVPSLYLYERFSQSVSSSRLNKSYISRRTASDANVSYKCSYERPLQNCFIPVKDNVGCYYAVVVDGKEYSLGDFFVKANTEAKTDKMKLPGQRCDTGKGVNRVSNEFRTKKGVRSKNYPTQECGPKEMASRNAKNRVMEYFEGGDSIRRQGKHVKECRSPDVGMFSRRKHSMFQQVRPISQDISVISLKDDSWSTIDSMMHDEPVTQGKMFAQNVIDPPRYKEVSDSPAGRGSCFVLKKNTGHKTNLARLGTNMESAHLKKLKAFIRAHRIDSGKLEFKERLALQWVESRGDKMPSVLHREKRTREFQDLSTHNAFFETVAAPVRIEQRVSRFVPHFPQNKKFLYEVKPNPGTSECRMPEIRERHQAPEVVMSFSQESMPLSSLFVPYKGPKPPQEAVKMKSNLWDLRKHKLKNSNENENGAEPESWNFKITK